MRKPFIILAAILCMTNASENQPRVVFAIDVSGSMDGKNIENAKNSVIDYLVTSVGSNDISAELGIVAYNQNATLVHEMTEINENTVETMMDSVEQLFAEGGTCIAAGIEAAVNWPDLIGERYGSSIFIFGDGESNSCEDEIQTSIFEVSKYAKVYLVDLGFGVTNITEEIVRETGGLIINGKDQTFEEISKLIQQRDLVVSEVPSPSSWYLKKSNPNSIMDEVCHLNRKTSAFYTSNILMGNNDLTHVCFKIPSVTLDTGEHLKGGWQHATQGKRECVDECCLFTPEPLNIRTKQYPDWYRSEDCSENTRPEKVNNGPIIMKRQEDDSTCASVCVKENDEYRRKVGLFIDIDCGESNCCYLSQVMDYEVLSFLTGGGYSGYEFGSGFGYNPYDSLFPGYNPYDSLYGSYSSCLG